MICIEQDLESRGQGFWLRVYPQPNLPVKDCEASFRMPWDTLSWGLAGGAWGLLADICCKVAVLAVLLLCSL